MQGDEQPAAALERRSAGWRTPGARRLVIGERAPGQIQRCPLFQRVQFEGAVGEEAQRAVADRAMVVADNLPGRLIVERLLEDLPILLDPLEGGQKQGNGLRAAYRRRSLSQRLQKELFPQASR